MLEIFENGAEREARYAMTAFQLFPNQAHTKKGAIKGGPSQNFYGITGSPSSG